MGERKFTLIELHVDDAQFGPGRLGEALPPLGGDVGTEEDQEETDAEDEEGGRSPIGVVVALAVLVGIALAVRKFRGGDDDEPEEFETSDEPDVIVDDD